MYKSYLSLYFLVIQHPCNKANNWAKEINFKDAKQPKDTNLTFVPIDFYLTPKRTHYETKSEPIVALDEINFKHKNNVILGGPGAGKTTLMKKIIIDLLNTDIKDRDFILPFLIQFRYIEGSQSSSIHELLLQDFGLELKISSDCERIINRYEQYVKEQEKMDVDSEFDEPKNLDPFEKLAFEQDLDEIEKQYRIAKQTYTSLIDKYQSFKEQLVVEFIDELNILFIFDGFDELPSNQVKEDIIKSIEKLSLGLDKSRFILTSRTGEFELVIPNTQNFEIADLNEIQIKTFINNWFEKGIKAKKMLAQLNESPFKDVSLRPLNLAHLCALFDRYEEIPKKPKTVYKKIVNLLIEEWDEQRNIKRVSKYSKFTLDRKFEFLCHLSYLLTSKYARAYFTKDLLQDCYEQICEKYELPNKESNAVINELENFTGLFINSGYDKFEFSHKSLQEYLAAEYIVRTNLILVRRQFLIEMPNELAIAISLSSNPSMFFASTIFELNHLAKKNTFIFPLFERIIVEKPDFESSYLLALSICYIYLLFNEEGNAQYLEEVKKHLLIFVNRQTLLKSFNELKLMYWKTENIENGFTLRVSRVGSAATSFDIDEMKVPNNIKMHIDLDEFLQGLYNNNLPPF